MQRHLAYGVGLALVLSAALPMQTLSAKASTPATTPPVLVTEVEGLKEYSLANGLKIVLFPDASKPRVTVNLTYFVGSRHEGYGEAGMAHLLEHMLFKGTPTRPDIWKMLQQQGANFNASTWYDRTNYFEMLPASKENLDFALALEADRMINSTIAPDQLAKEFSVVRNEFEQGENDPGGILLEQMFSTAYQWHGYGRTTIGNKSDIEKVPVPKLREFYQKYYQPDNALLVVAGSFDEKEALALIEKNFGPIPRPERKLIETYTVEPVQEGEREIVLRRQGEQAVVGVLYHTVAGSDPAAPAVDALVSALAQKPSGILYKELVLKGLATEVGGSSYSLAEPGAFYFIAKVAKGKDPREISKKMISLIENLKPNQITEADLRRYQADFSRAFDLGMTDSGRIGIELSEYSAMGDWRLLFLNRDRVENLKLDQLKTAFQYFKPSNRTLGIFIPTKDADRTALLTRPDVTAMVKGYKGKAEMEAGEAFNPSFDAIMARTQYSELPNGMKIALMPKKSRGAPVSFSMELPVGTATSLKNRLAALHFLPRFMLRGTKKRDYEQIRDELAVLKASIHGGSSWDIDSPNSVSFAGTTIKGKLPQVLDLFGEVLNEPRFDPVQFELAKKELVANLIESREDPGELAQRAFLRAVGNYPATDIRYIPTIDEEIKMVEALKLADVKEVYQKMLGGSAGRLVMVGDFDPAQVKAQLTKLIGTWKAPIAYEPILYESKPVTAKVQTFDTPDKKGATVTMVQTFKFKENDPRYPASRVASLVWGQGASSRLINRLRQKDGISYGAGGSFRADQKGDVGYLSAFAISAPSNVAKAIAAIREEAAKFAKDGITATELKEAKIAYAEQRRNALTRDSTIMDLISTNIDLERTLAFNKELDEKIAALTLEEVNAVVKDLVDPAKFLVIEALDKKAASLPVPAAATPGATPTQGT